MVENPVNMMSNLGGGKLCLISPSSHLNTMILNLISHRGHFADQMLNSAYVVHEEHIFVHHGEV